ncbi:uncharacterized protein TNCV_1637031 [Trichonephila clavipes]|nr:uncharacterized protein TNCV_1637031 [Trichonephila clavipes]
MEIRTDISDSNSSHNKLSRFESEQRRTNESQYGRKRGSGVKRGLEEKEISFKIFQGERHKDKTDKRGPLIKSHPGSCSEPSRKFKMSRKETLAYKRSLHSGSGEPERKQRKGQKH